MSLVETNRRHLEKSGEYVIRANASKGWFAVFPKKLEACRSKARANARTDFHFIISLRSKFNATGGWLRWLT